jgi:hypothetical protein
MTLTKFAKHLNYSRASNREFRRILEYLQKRGMLIVEQGGFISDSMHHPKVVTVLKPLEIGQFKHLILERVNYSVGQFTVHRTKNKRRCHKCKHTVEFGERYASTIYGQEILCLYCLLENIRINDDDSDIQVIFNRNKTRFVSPGLCSISRFFRVVVAPILFERPLMDSCDFQRKIRLLPRPRK